LIPAFLPMLQGINDKGRPVAKLPRLKLEAVLGHDFQSNVRGQPNNYFAAHAKIICDSSPKIQLLYKMAREQTNRTKTQTIVPAGAVPVSRLGQVVARTEYPLVCHAVQEALQWRARVRTPYQCMCSSGRTEASTKTRARQGAI
jgi:hypothetical protein